MKKRSACFAVLCMLALAVCTAVFAVSASAAGDIAINKTNFPDPYFRAYIVFNVDTNGNGSLSESEYSGVTSLDLSNKNIADLTGISYFTNLTRLECRNNRLEALDVTGNTALTYLDISNDGTAADGSQTFNCNNISSLKISTCTALTYLDCRGNALSTPAVFNSNTKLEELHCDGNNFSSINITRLTAIKVFTCGGNRMTALNLTYNKQLETLDCSNNQLSTLTLTALTKLKSLDCSNNRNITTLNLSKNTALTDLRCDGNKLTALDLGINTQLMNLSCAYNNIGYLDVSANTALVSLVCDGNPLYALNTGSNTGLTSVSCSYCAVPLLIQNQQFSVSALTGFDPAKTSNWAYGNLTADNTAIAAHLVNMPKYATYDYAYNTAGNTVSLRVEYFVALDATNFPDASFLAYLTNFDIDGDNKLSYEERTAIKNIDVSRTAISSLKGIEYLTHLEGLKAENCGLKGTLDLWNNKKVRTLYLANYAKTNGEANPYRNALTGLNVTACTQMTYLDCRSNAIATLDLSKCTVLQIALCSANRLTSLDVTGCTKLSTLHCNSNRLQALSLDTNTSLLDLDCSANNIKSLTLSACTELLHLNCSNNDLTALSLASNAALVSVNCGYNRLSALSVSNLKHLNNLHCEGNALTTLDVTANTALEELACHRNKLTTLDVTKNTSLATLLCDDNDLTSLNVASNSVLQTLSCDGNALTVLDVSANAALVYLSCGNNQLTHLNLDNENNNKMLETLNCSGNVRKVSLSNGTFDLKTIGNGFDHTKAWDWTDVFTFNNGMKDSNGILTVPATTSHLEYTYQCSPYFTAKFTLDIELPSVTINATTFPDAAFRAYVTSKIDLDGNGVLSSDERKAVGYLDVRSMGIADLSGIAYFPELSELYCDNNALTTLDVSSNKYLTMLSCGDNSLKTLDVSGNPMLAFVPCHNNELESLNTGNNASLLYVACGGNRLAMLDLSQNPAVSYVDTEGNIYEVTSENGVVQLSSLPAGFDVSKASEWQGATVNGDTLVVDSGVSTVTFTYACSDTQSETFTLSVVEQHAVLGGYTVTLGDALGVNFYMQLDDVLLEDAGAYMQFTVDGVTTMVSINEATTDPTLPEYYIFTRKIYATQMTEEIFAQMFDSQGTAVSSNYSYTVAEYGEYIVDNYTAEAHKQTANLAKAMLNYGAAAQLHFNVNTDVLANACLSAADNTVTTPLTSAELANLATYEYEWDGAGDVAGVTYMGNTVTLDSNIMFTYYFRLNSGNISDYVFKLEGVTVTPTYNETYDMYAIDVRNIRSNELRHKYELTISGKNGTATETVKYSVYSYVYTVKNDTNSYGANVQNAVNALYRYGEAAYAYNPND